MTTTPKFLAITLAVAATAILSPNIEAQQSLEPPPNAKLISLNPTPGRFTEPAIAINPKNPNQIAAAFQVPASIAYSTDAGATWQIAKHTAPENYAISGDVSITYDSHGHAILCYIAFDKLGTSQYWAHNATRNGIFIRRSLDGGKSWESNAISVDEQPTRKIMPFEDKPYIVADNNPGSPHAGNLYIGWTEFTLEKATILFSRSTDGGKTWSPPREISTHEGLPRDDTGAVEGFTAAAGTDGTLYAAWADGSTVAMAISKDGGATFAPSHAILDTAPSYYGVEAVERANGFPQLGMDPQTNRLFLTFSDYRNGDVDVFCSTSIDRGATWSPATRVNTDPLHDGADQFFQWLAVDPTDGSANVVFYDRRHDPNNRALSVVLARSTDGGQTFNNYAWAIPPFDPEGNFIGDYSGIAALNDKVYAVWTGRAPSPPTKPQTKSANKSTSGETGETATNAANSGNAANPQNTEQTEEYSGLKMAHTIIQLGSADFSTATH
ncbi:MAG: sialidase family protein [Candidatus Acidiferrales bacterium]